MMIDDKEIETLFISGYTEMFKRIQTGWSLLDEWNKTVSKFGDKIFIKYIDSKPPICWTYKEMDERSNQMANCLLSMGVKPGSIVSLMMDNRPEYIMSWIGIMKMGCTAPLINTNLSGKTLLHSFLTAHCTHFIIGHEHIETITELRKSLTGDPKEINVKTGTFFVSGGESDGYICLEKLMEKYPKTNQWSSKVPKLLPTDVIMYIYTSGTTGFPKAIKMWNWILWSVGIFWNSLYKITSDDVYYCCLPLYHSAAGIIVTSCVLSLGMTMVLKRKFSATSFWKDCTENNCTVVQYIGELLHYLHVRPPSPYDRAHKIRVMCGNGLRASLWSDFKERFAIPNIYEVYAATEAVMIHNLPQKPGAVAYIPKALLDSVFPLRLIKYDIDSDTVVRNEKGLCVPCENNEPGQLIHKLNVTAEFRGYTDPVATEKKFLRNVFDEGDLYYLTGDLLKCDAEGFYYFVDRIGDTFRWKGENVATGEVENVIKTGFPGINEIMVYGVEIPFTSGRAGMAYLIADKSFDLKKFYQYTQEALPSYAVPLFLRFGKEIEVTGTFKHKKANRRIEGFNPAIIKEPLFFRDNRKKAYVPVTKELFDWIMKGESKL